MFWWTRGWYRLSGKGVKYGVIIVSRLFFLATVSTLLFSPNVFFSFPSVAFTSTHVYPPPHVGYLFYLVCEGMCVRWREGVCFTKEAFADRRRGQWTEYGAEMNMWGWIWERQLGGKAQKAKGYWQMCGRRIESGEGYIHLAAREDWSAVFFLRVLRKNCWLDLASPWTNITFSKPFCAFALQFCILYGSNF